MKEKGALDGAPFLPSFGMKSEHWIALVVVAPPVEVLPALIYPIIQYCTKNYNRKFAQGISTFHPV